MAENDVVRIPGQELEPFVVINFLKSSVFSGSDLCCHVNRDLKHNASSQFLLENILETGPESILSFQHLFLDHCKNHKTIIY